MSSVTGRSAPVFRLAKLRSKTLAAASQFHDYNFRSYFVQKTVDTFNEVSRKPDDEIREWCNGEGKQQMQQMQRMALVNATFARTPVFLDPALQKSSGKRGSSKSFGSLDDNTSASKTDEDLTSSLPHGGPANRKLRPEEDADEEGQSQTHH